jgi:hypothetical protein
MKAREFLSEASGKLAQAGSIPGTASNTLPMVLSIPYLRGFDSYMQYRYSMALAAARAMQQGLISQEQFDQESAFARKHDTCAVHPSGAGNSGTGCQTYGCPGTAYFQCSQPRT